MNQNI